MKNLQSRDLPFRTIQQYYEPLLKQKSGQGIKVFHKPNKQSIIIPTGTLPSIISYISGLNEAKNLPRRVHNRHEYFSMRRQCKRHQSTIEQNSPQQEDKQESAQTTRIRMNTFLSNNTTNKSMLQILTQKNSQQRKLQQQKSQFDFYKTLKKQQGQKQQRFSFYNTIEKSDYFLKKFKEDNSLHERRANKYQNMMRRNITAQKILQLLDKSKQKYRHGH